RVCSADTVLKDNVCRAQALACESKHESRGTVAPRLSCVAKLATRRPVTYFKHRQFSSPSQWGNARVLVVGCEPGNPEGHDARPRNYRLLVTIRRQAKESSIVTRHRDRN